MRLIDTSIKTFESTVIPDDADDLLSKGNTWRLTTVFSATLSQYPLPILAIHLKLTLELLFPS